MPRRVPLFWFSIAFATGCMLGLDGAVSWPVALGIVAVTGLAWLVARGERVSLALFYLFAIVAALAHTLILASTIPPNDVRRLPDDKRMASTQWRGIVSEDPQTAARRNRRALDRTTFALEIRAWRPTGGLLFDEADGESWRTASGRLACTVLGPAADIRAGDEIEFAAASEPVAAPLVPGQLNLRTYDAQQDIYAQAFIRPLDWRRVDRPDSTEPWWQKLSYRARDWAYERLQRGLEDDPRTANFLAGMLIGYRAESPEEIEQHFRVTGTLHVFAISGQNVAEMVVVVIILLQLVGLVRWRWAWVLAPLVLVYCLLAGSPASAVRATVMALAVLLAWRLGRPLNALGCWSIALLAMMAWDPRVLRDPGAQLSFGVVLGLILVAPPVYRFALARFRHDPFVPARLLTVAQKGEEVFWARAVALLAASLAATVVSEPITAINFHQVTPISIIANLLVVPLAGLITTVGTISLTFSLVSHTLAALCNNANWLLARIMIGIVAFFAHEPGAAINVPDLRVAAQQSPFFVAAPLEDSACLLVKDGSHAWLVDTGREAPSMSASARLLQFYGINRLDGLILAQMSTPANGGAEAVVREFRPRRLVMPALASRSPFQREISGLASAAAVKPETWSRGESFALGPSVRVDVLGPALDSTESREDDRGLVLLFHAQGGTVLWAGRVDAAAQADLARVLPGLHADVMGLGADMPPDAGWLDALGPRFWLELPPRQRGLNQSTPSEPLAAPCAIWPLGTTGAVTVRFTGSGKAAIELRPWVGAP
jgi:competence protein ComEC